MNAKEACEVIGCTRPYLSILVKKNKIRVVKSLMDYNDVDVRSYVLVRENKRNNYVTKEETQ
jgi:hypothetical protein